MPGPQTQCLSWARAGPGPCMCVSRTGFSGILSILFVFHERNLPKFWEFSLCSTNILFQNAGHIVCFHEENPTEFYNFVCVPRTEFSQNCKIFLRVPRTKILLNERFFAFHKQFSANCWEFVCVSRTKYPYNFYFCSRFTNKIFTDFRIVACVPRKRPSQIQVFVSVPRTKF